MSDVLDTVQYFRLSRENAHYLRDLAHQSGMPVSRIADAIIGHAKTQGWRIQTSVTKVVEGDEDHDTA